LRDGEGGSGALDVIARFMRVARRLRDSQRLARLPHDLRISRNLAEAMAASAARRPEEGVRRYLEERRALGRLEVTRDWYEASDRAELRLDYASRFFGPGCLRLVKAPSDRGTVVFLHGSTGSAAQVLDVGARSPAHSLAERAGLGIACWDWPIHGERLAQGVYGGLTTTLAAEAQYAVLLTALGSSLWREWVAELGFALEQLRRASGAGARLHVVGSSMGAAFAYVAPTLATPLASVTAINSCARFADLVAEGAARAHGPFFYPLDVASYFDLEDLVAVALDSGVPMFVIHGDRDPGCLESSRERLGALAGPAGDRVRIEVLPDHDHVFSEAIAERVEAFLREVEARGARADTDQRT
jgi:dienelactone hydrolase